DALQQPTDSVTELIRTVQVELRNFTGHKEQTTDCTLLAVEFKGKWMQQKQFTLNAGDTAALSNMANGCNAMLESVLASPVAIAELQTAVADIICALPTGSEVNLRFSCNEEEAEITLTYNIQQFNPLEHLPALPLDSGVYCTDPTEGSTLKLTKSLA
ncbi:MAG: hypothetical protein IKL98_07705, partial [Akkermansia sp.]|nr:hypothetical protein [Akkermansia sp.]